MRRGSVNPHWLPALDYGFEPRASCGRCRPGRSPCRLVRPLSSLSPLGLGAGAGGRLATRGPARPAGGDRRLLRGFPNHAEHQPERRPEPARLRGRWRRDGFLRPTPWGTTRGCCGSSRRAGTIDTRLHSGRAGGKRSATTSRIQTRRRIRQAGQAEMVRRHHPDVKLREVLTLCCDGGASRTSATTCAGRPGGRGRTRGAEAGIPPRGRGLRGPAGDAPHGPPRDWSCSRPIRRRSRVSAICPTGDRPAGRLGWIQPGEEGPSSRHGGALVG